VRWIGETARPAALRGAARRAATAAALALPWLLLAAGVVQGNRAWGELEAWGGAQWAGMGRGHRSAPAPTPSGAMLETDPDAEARLARVMQYLAEGRASGDYESALTLLQLMVDRHGRTLTHMGGGLYLPANRVAEQVLRAADAQDGRVLRQYRLMADAAAKGLLGGEPGQCRDVDALRRAARRYFLSGVGDEAAYVLGCLLMDRGRVGEAAASFARIWHEHPRSTVDRASLLLRWAVASSRSGDRRRGAWALGRLRQVAGVEARAIAAAESAVSEAGATAGASAAGWPMRGGGRGRGGVMPPVASLAEAGGEVELVTSWRDRFPLAAPEGVWGGVSYRLGSAAHTTAAELAGRARSHQWTPVGQVLHDAERLYYRTHDAVVCRDRTGGRVLWTRRRPDENLDGDYAKVHEGETGGQPYPVTAEEVLAFEDELGKRMTLIDGTLYYVERTDVSGWVDRAMAERWAESASRVPLGSALVAVDARTGEARWRRGRTIPPELASPLGAVRFLAPPVRAGGRLVTLIERHDAVVLVGLEPGTGEVAFESLVCEVETRNWPWWQAAAIAVDETRVYGLFGRGIVFAASMEDGSLRWVRRYRRSPGREGRDPERQPLRQAGVAGWASNGLHIIGQALAATPYDAESLLLIDRRTGRPAVDAAGAGDGRRWVIETPGARHVIGVHGQRLVAAVGEAIVAYDTASGAVAWRAEGISPTGRAALTPRAIYVPAGQRIVQLDPRADGKRVRQLVVGDAAGRPLGNLFSTGHTLAAYGIGTVEGLSRPDDLLAELDRRIARSPNGEDYLIRGRLLARLGREEAAMADFRRAFGRAESEAVRIEAGEALAERLLAMVGTGLDDGAAMARLDEAAAMVAETPSLAARIDLARARLQHRRGAIEQALRTYQKLIGAAPEGGAVLVRIKDHWGERRVNAADVATRALAALARSERARAMPVLADEAEVALARAVAGRRAARDDARARDAVQRLAQVVRLFPTTPAALGAIERLGWFDERLGLALPRHLLRPWSESADPATAARALAALANLHADAGWLAEARHQWRALGDRFGDRAMVWGGRLTTAIDLADRMLERIGVGGLDPPHRAPEARLRRQWHRPGMHPQQALISFSDAPRSTFQRRHALHFDSGANTVACLPLAALHDEGERRWRIKDPAIDRWSVSDGGRLRFAGWLADHRMLTWDHRHVRGYSLLTGRLLWQCPRPRTLPTDAAGFDQLHDEAADAGSGYSRIAMDDQTLAWLAEDAAGRPQVVARDPAAGRLRWRRTVAAGQPSGVVVTGPCIAVVLNRGQTVRAFDRDTGRPLAEVQQRRPPERLAWSGPFMLSQWNNNLRCIDLRDGQPRWSARVYDRGGEAAFGVLADGSVWTQNDDGQAVSIRDPRTGRQRLRFRRDDRAQCLDLVLSPDGSRSVVVWRNGSNFEVSVLDRGTGRERVRITPGRATVGRPDAGHLAWTTGPIPWPGDQRVDGRRTGHRAIQWYDRSSGERIPRLSLAEADGQGGGTGRLLRWPRVLGRRVVIESRSGLSAFGEASAPAAQDKQRAAGSAGDSP